MSLLYADSSALVKLLITEPETAALRRHLDREDAAVVTSAVGIVELARVAARGGAPHEAVKTIRQSILVVPLTDPVSDAAMLLPPTVMRSLDAIHVASALRCGDLLDAVVTYDRRMAEACEAAGLTVVTPGVA